MTPLRHQLTFAILAVVCASCAKPLATAAIQPAAAAQEQKPSAPKDRLIKQGKVSTISMEDFFALHTSGQALVYDARQAFFYNLGHIPGAILLTRSENDSQILIQKDVIESALKEGKRIITYCSGPGCPDARTVARHIARYGYPVSVFSGGWHAWQDAGLPAE